MISNEEAFIRADVAARQHESEIGRKLSSEEYERFVIWYINHLHNPYLEDLGFEAN